MTQTVVINVEYQVDHRGKVKIVEDGELVLSQTKTLSTIWNAQPIIPRLKYYDTDKKEIDWVSFRHSLLMNNLLAWSEDIIVSEHNINNMLASIASALINKYDKFIQSTAKA